MGLQQIEISIKPINNFEFIIEGLRPGYVYFSEDLREDIEREIKEGLFWPYDAETWGNYLFITETDERANPNN